MPYRPAITDPAPVDVEDLADRYVRTIAHLVFSGHRLEPNGAAVHVVAPPSKHGTKRERTVRVISADLARAAQAMLHQFDPESFPAPSTTPPERYTMHDYAQDPRVLEAQEKLQNTRHDAEAADSQAAELEAEADDLNTKADDLEALAAVGEAEPSAAEEARAAAQDAADRAAGLRRDAEAKRRAIALLDERRNEARKRAKGDVMASVVSEAESVTEDALEAIRALLDAEARMEELHQAAAHNAGPFNLPPVISEWQFYIRKPLELGGAPKSANFRMREFLAKHEDVQKAAA